MHKTDLILFQSKDGMVSLTVNMDETLTEVWLSRSQIAMLYDRDVKTIGKHVNNALREELADTENPTVAKIATVQVEGKREVTRQVEHYNLDVILSVGYRIKSQRGIEFRHWANEVLHEYVICGRAENKNRLIQLKQVTQIIDRMSQELESRQILDVIKSYTKALDMLDDYDHQRLTKPDGSSATYVLSYDECRDLINKMRFSTESNLFGNEKDDSFKGSISAIYQSFNGEDVYPSLEEKAANLLYFVVKNHSFSDGNKRIAAALFLYFLDKNNALFDANKDKLIADATLVAITIMIAESKPSEKEVLVSLVMNFLRE